MGGIPLIIRTINAAKKSQFLNRVIVSTDDIEISNISEENNVDVFNRTKELSNDKASSEAVVLDVLQKLKINENFTPEITVLLQCTSPFTTSDDIDKTIQSLIKFKADSAFSATEFKHFLWKKCEGQSAVGINHDENILRNRRQDLKPQYLETGAIYVFNTEGFIKNKNRFFGKIILYNMPYGRAMEIDSHFDLKVANTISKNT